MELFTKRRRPKRKRMREFRIEELSVVDRPAQEGALVTIMKRRDPVADLAALANQLPRIQRLLGKAVRQQATNQAALGICLKSIYGDPTLSPYQKELAIVDAIGDYAHVAGLDEERKHKMLKTYVYKGRRYKGGDPEDEEELEMDADEEETDEEFLQRARDVLGEEDDEDMPKRRRRRKAVLDDEDDEDEMMPKRRRRRKVVTAEEDDDDDDDFAMDDAEDEDEEANEEATLLTQARRKARRRENADLAELKGEYEEEEERADKEDPDDEDEDEPNTRVGILAQQLRARDRRMSKRMANAMAAARIAAQRGIYAKAFAGDSRPVHGGRERAYNKRSIDIHVGKVRSANPMMTATDAIRLVRKRHPRLFQ